MRHIETNADEIVDANWTVEDNAWTSGALEYTITGLTNGTEYDMQMRAVKLQRRRNLVGHDQRNSSGPRQHSCRSHERDRGRECVESH